MTGLKLDAQNLLATAIAAFRAEILPTVPADRRHAALMIANALTMAEREFTAGRPKGLPHAAVLYPTEVLTPAEFEERLARDIEAGAFDADGPLHEVAFAAVKAINAARLAITNPKLLPGEG